MYVAEAFFISVLNDLDFILCATTLCCYSLSFAYENPLTLIYNERSCSSKFKAISLSTLSSALLRRFEKFDNTPRSVINFATISLASIFTTELEVLDLKYTSARLKIFTTSGLTNYLNLYLTNPNS